MRLSQVSQSDANRLDWCSNAFALHASFSGKGGRGGDSPDSGVCRFCPVGRAGTGDAPVKHSQNITEAVTHRWWVPPDRDKWEE